MTLHYHGTPISPRAALAELGGCCFCVSYAAPQDVAVVHEIGQSVMLDNGAFSFWMEGTRGLATRETPTDEWTPKPASIKSLAAAEGDWSGYYAWAEQWLEKPTTWAVIPDVITGSEEDNDRLLVDWFARGMPHAKGAPVWHMHEPVDRLRRLCAGYEKVCIGSSGEYATLDTPQWHRRMEQAMNVACRHETPWLHMLRGMAMSGSQYPFASVDSTDVARNHNRPQNTPVAMVRRWDSRQCPARWEYREQIAMTLVRGET